MSALFFPISPKEQINASHVTTFVFTEGPRPMLRINLSDGRQVNLSGDDAKQVAGMLNIHTGNHLKILAALNRTQEDEESQIVMPSFQSM